MNNYQFALHLEKTSNLNQAEKILNRYLNYFEIKAYSFTYYSKHTKSGQKLRFHCVSPALRPWHEYYLEQNFADIDRTLEVSHTMTLPLFWTIEEQLKNAKNNRELMIRKESQDFGIDQGLALPIHGPHEDFCTLNLHQFKNENGLKNYEDHQYEWLSAAHIFYHHIKKILDLTNTANIYELTKREKQCLLLTAQEFRTEQIAEELQITERTVHFHIQNANKKLGSHNKYQSAYKYLTHEK